LRIGIVSDSHGKGDNLIKAVKKMGHVDMIFHLGDFIIDVGYIKKVYSGNIYSIMGNCDRMLSKMGINKEAARELLIDIEDKKIFATHGHEHNVKHDLISLYYRGKEVNADIVLFGHTHYPQIIQEEDMILINPGSTTNPRRGLQPTFGIIEITDGNIKPEIIEI